MPQRWQGRPCDSHGSQAVRAFKVVTSRPMFGAIKVPFVVETNIDKCHCSVKVARIAIHLYWIRGFITPYKCRSLLPRLHVSSLSVASMVCVVNYVSNIYWSLACRCEALMLMPLFFESPNTAMHVLCRGEGRQVVDRGDSLINIQSVGSQASLFTNVKVVHAVVHCCRETRGVGGQCYQSHQDHTLYGQNIGRTEIKYPSLICEMNGPTGRDFGYKVKKINIRNLQSYLPKKF